MLLASILIIDSDAGVISAFGKSLGRQGFVVYGTTSAFEGWKVLQTKQPQALILDIPFPESQGIELLREAKVLYPALPIIVITRYSTSFTAADAKREGADGYFVKPFDPQALLEKIQALTFAPPETRAELPPIKHAEAVASWRPQSASCHLILSY